jgi:hypothetical protein
VVLGWFVAAAALLPRGAGAQGSPLGPEFRVNTYTTGYQVAASVSASAGGDFVVLWSSLQEGASPGIFGQRYAGGGTPAGPEFHVNTFTAFVQAAPAVDFDSSGSFIAVWQSDLQDGSSRGVYAQRYAASGAPLGPEFRVNTFTTGPQAAPEVSRDPAGTFVVVWGSYGQDGDGGGIFGQRYAASGTPLGTEFRVNTFTTGSQGNAEVAGDAAGNFVVVWGIFGNSVFGQRYDSSGAPLGPEFRVNTQAIAAFPRPSVASDAAGNFVVVWETLDGDGSGVFGQRYASSGAPLGSEFRVNSYTTSYQTTPSVAADPSGNFVIVWTSIGQDGSSAGVFGQRFDNAGVSQGTEFQVNTYTTIYQVFPAVAADGSGDFVVAWASMLQDGSDWGIFGQRYAPIVPVELMHVGVE